MSEAILFQDQEGVRPFVIVTPTRLQIGDDIYSLVGITRVEPLAKPFTFSRWDGIKAKLLWGIFWLYMFIVLAFWVVSCGHDPSNARHSESIIDKLIPYVFPVVILWLAFKASVADKLRCYNRGLIILHRGSQKETIIVTPLFNLWPDSNREKLLRSHANYTDERIADEKMKVESESSRIRAISEAIGQNIGRPV